MHRLLSSTPPPPPLNRTSTPFPGHPSPNANVIDSQCTETLRDRAALEGTVEGGRQERLQERVRAAAKRVQEPSWRSQKWGGGTDSHRRGRGGGHPLHAQVCPGSTGPTPAARTHRVPCRVPGACVAALLVIACRIANGPALQSIRSTPLFRDRTRVVAPPPLPPLPPPTTPGPALVPRRSAAAPGHGPVL